MALVFRELHKAKSPDALNEEWLLLENTGPNVVNAQQCALTVARRANERPHPLGTLDPGFILKPNEQIRLVTGTPSKKAQGTPPEEKDGLKNYHLFLREPVSVGVLRTLYEAAAILALYDLGYYLLHRFALMSYASAVEP